MRALSANEPEVVLRNYAVFVLATLLALWGVAVLTRDSLGYRVVELARQSNAVSYNYVDLTSEVCPHLRLQDLMRMYQRNYGSTLLEAKDRLTLIMPFDLRLPSFVWSTVSISLDKSGDWCRASKQLAGF